MKPAPITFRYVASLLFLSLGGAWVSAAVYVPYLYVSLPLDDGFRETALLATITDPSVVVVSVGFATILGLILWPWAVFCLRRRPVLRSATLVLAGTLIFIVTVTPLLFGLVFALAPMVTFLLLGYCREGDPRFLQVDPSSH